MDGWINLRHTLFIATGKLYCCRFFSSNFRKSLCIVIIAGRNYFCIVQCLIEAEEASYWKNCRVGSFVHYFHQLVQHSSLQNSLQVLQSSPQHQSLSSLSVCSVSLSLWLWCCYPNRCWWQMEDKQHPCAKPSVSLLNDNLSLAFPV